LHALALSRIRRAGLGYEDAADDRHLGSSWPDCPRHLSLRDGHQSEIDHLVVAPSYRMTAWGYTFLEARGTTQ
jgi:hypothetical protein